MEEKDLAIETEKVIQPGAGRPPARDKQNTFFATVQDFAGRVDVEQRGIERVLPGERTDTSSSKIGTLVRSLKGSKRDG